MFDGSESRKISDTLTSCIKKNESFVDAVEECDSYKKDKLETVDIEIHQKGISIFIIDKDGIYLILDVDFLDQNFLYFTLKYHFR